MEENKFKNNFFDKYRIFLIILFFISLLLPYFTSVLLPPLYIYIWSGIFIGLFCLVTLVITSIILSLNAKTSFGKYIYFIIVFVSVIVFTSSLRNLMDTRNYIYIVRHEAELNFLVSEVKKSGAKDISLSEGVPSQFTEIKKILREQSIKDVKVLNDSCILFQQGGFLSADGIGYSISKVKPKEYYGLTITIWFHIKDNWYWWGT